MLSVLNNFIIHNFHFKNAKTQRFSLLINRKLSYYRYAPQELRRQYKCRKPSKFYFYNVASARCEALSGVCTTSENKFPTFDSCMKSCIVQSEDLSEEEWTIWNLYNQDSRYYDKAAVAQVIFHKIEKTTK